MLINPRTFACPDICTSSGWAIYLSCSSESESEEESESWSMDESVNYFKFYVFNWKLKEKVIINLINSDFDQVKVKMGHSESMNESVNNFDFSVFS